MTRHTEEADMGTAILLALAAIADEPAKAKYPLPDGTAKKAAELWKKEYEKQKPATEELVKSLRNAVGKDGLARKAAAEKQLKKMGSEPFYVEALRVHDDQWGEIVKGRLGCLKGAEVTVIKEHPEGWIGKAEFSMISATYLFIEPSPGKAKINKKVERTGMYYAFTADGGDAFWRAVLVPVPIDPKDMPSPPEKK